MIGLQVILIKYVIMEAVQPYVETILELVHHGLKLKILMALIQAQIKMAIIILAIIIPGAITILVQVNHVLEKALLERVIKVGMKL
tara:strand:+ start:332 stop:589 length:258 start_codon:yes stop_codon:yes gene_type:complete